MEGLELDKLKKVREHIKLDLESTVQTSKLYKDASDKGVYALKYELAADFLKRTLEYLDSEFPYLKDST